MKRILLSLFCLFLFCANANEINLKEENLIQTRINNVAVNLLNLNKIEKRVIFVYDKKAKNGILKSIDNLAKRQVVVYEDLYKAIQTDDELAAMLAREISIAMKSYSGIWGGKLDSIQVALSSKKFETLADKRAVDYMISANYNPLALITYIHKTCPQKRCDKFSRHNLTSKRLARIYEYITFKYPQCLENNEYINNEYYQNFLLTSIENRKLLEEKIRTNSIKEVKYE